MRRFRIPVLWARQASPSSRVSERLVAERAVCGGTSTQVTRKPKAPPAGIQGGSRRRFRPLVQRRSRCFIELDLLDAEDPAPLRLITQTVLERLLRVSLGKVNVDGLGISGLNERIQTHQVESTRLIPVEQPF